MSFATGWIPNPEAVAAFRASGIPQSIAGVSVEGGTLAGNWERLKARGVTGVFLWDAETALFGKPVNPQFQRRGTCVGRGSFCSVRLAYWWRIAMRGTIGKPVDFCYEPNYGDARVRVGGGRLGRAMNNPNNDGCFGPWYAQSLHDKGILVRGVHGQYDLTRDREDLAVQFGDTGAPAGIWEKALKLRACYDAQVIQGMADCISAGHPIAYCSMNLYGDNDAKGFARPTGRGGHCEMYDAVFLDENGELCFCKRGSWDLSYPGGGKVLSFAGGQKELAPGGSGIRGSHVAAGLQEDGEAWAFDLEEGPRPEAAA